MPKFLSLSEKASLVRQSHDVIGRSRVSTPYRLFDSKNTIDNQPNLWDDIQVSGTATSTHNLNRASVVLGVTSAAVGNRVRQSKFRIPYQPSKSQQIIMTGVVGGGVNGSVKRFGLFDNNNGLFFQVNSDGLAVVIRSNVTGTPVDRVVYQSQFNIEKMNGRDVAGTILDLSKANIFIIEFEWLGVGSVRFGIVIDGIPRYLHIFNNANHLSSVYMSTSSLPVRFEIHSTQAVNDSIECICSAVNSEGGNEIAGWPYAIDRGVSGFATLASADIFPVLSIRLKQAALSARIILDNLNILCENNASFHWCLYLNPTIVGPALVYADANPRSAVEAAVATTNANTITVGANTVKLLGGYINTANNTPSSVQLIDPLDFLIGSTYAGVSDVVSLGVRSVSGQAITIYPAMNYREMI